MELVRIGELARLSRVPIATIKHYLREGLIAPTRKSGRTMSWYDPALASRIRSIKELQRRQFLPLDVIKSSLASTEEAPDDLAAAQAIAKVLAKRGGKRSRTRDELLARGVRAAELDALAAMGLAVPAGADRRYSGDDLALLVTLGAARTAGLSADMLPFEILDRYLGAIRALVAVELEMFRRGVLRNPTGDVARLTTAATNLSEKLVVLVRRKLLLPTLHTLIEEDADAKRVAGDRHARPRRLRTRERRQRRRRLDR